MNLGMDRRAFVNLTGAVIVGLLGLQASDSLEPTTSSHSAVTPISSAFVTAQGQELRLDGKPYRFIGVNRYNLLTPADGSCGASFSAKDLEDWFNEMGKIGVNAVRFWLFESVTKDNFQRFDRVLELSEKNNIKVIPVFEDEWAYCSPVDQEKYAGADGRKNALWYQEGYQKAYKPYVEQIVAKYARDPRILMWQLMNEAESTDAVALQKFVQDMSASVKALDKNHLTSLGTTGSGQAGTGGEDYRILHRGPTINLLEYHDYHDPQTPFPDALAEHFSDALFLKKPLFIGEAGIKLDGSITPEGRSELLQAKMEAFFSRGGVGYVIWSGPDVGETESVSYSFVLGDPVVPVITGMAEKYCGFS